MIHPIRSLLFAPANRADFIAKFGRIPADAFAIDMEDGLPAAERPRIRQTLPKIVADARQAAKPGARILVRINAASTEDFVADCEAIPGSDCDGIILAKAESADEVTRAATLSKRPVLAGIESIEGLYAVDAICAVAELGVFFGAEDFIADLGGIRTPEGAEVAYPRARVAIAARRAKVPALDLVTIDVKDAARFDADAKAGRSLGYTGKMCITPRQVERANAIYRPDAMAVDAAKRLIAAYADAQARGLGTIAFEERMVDEPLVRQARAIIDAADS